MMELLLIELVNFTGELLYGLKELSDLLKKGLLFGDMFWNLKVSEGSSLLSRRLNRSRLLLVDG